MAVDEEFVVRKTTIALIVVAATGLAVVARPQLRYSTICSNDACAASSLRYIAQVENEFRDAQRIDVDRDGAGEFGFLGELAGACALPGGRYLSPPLLSGVWRNVEFDGIVRRAGYRFRVFLPDAHGDGVDEIGCLCSPPLQPSPADVRECGWSGFASTLPTRAASTDRVDARTASRTWCAYAWPSEYGRSGTWTFFVDQDGVVLHVNAPGYSGEHGPEPGAAFVSGGRICITGETRSGASAQDGLDWTEAP